MTPTIHITHRQNEYLKEFISGPHTTRHFTLEFAVSQDAAAKMLKKLRAKELIKPIPTTNRHGNYRCYELSRNYDEMIADGSLKIDIDPNGRVYASTSIVADEQVLYTAILRNAGLIGQRLEAQFRKQYPECTLRTMISPVAKARAMHLCR